MSSFSLISNNATDWISAGLEILPERYVKVEQGIDPRQAFCSYIFYPGRFQREVIDKALIVSRFCVQRLANSLCVAVALI